MSATKEPCGAAEADLIDRIANALPVEVRADYYRELRHCRSLPANDEMLRILRAMQFSVLLMVEAPGRMATERQRLDETLGEALSTLREFRQASVDYHAQLDRRLTQLPADIAKGISPEAIVATINESLRQQFVRSTIPQAADALAVFAARIKETTGEFARTASTLGDSYDGAAQEARRAISQLESVCSKALSSTQRSAENLLRIFHQEYRWSLYALLSLALVMGIGLHMLFENWLSGPTPVDHAPPAVQSAPPAKPRAKP